MKPAEVIKKIKSQYKSKPCPATYDKMEVGQVHWQGDVGIKFIERLPENATLSVPQNPQLAPGSTRGSRHIIRSLKGVKIYSIGGNALQGPVVESSKPITITHPDHGNLTVPGGTYSIHYQRMYAEVLRRVVD